MPNPSQTPQGTFSNVSGTTIALAYANPVVAGRTLACVVMWSSTTATVTVSDSVNGAWTADATSLGSGGSRRAQWFYFKNTAAGTPTVTGTVSGNVNERNLHIFEIPSINQSTPVDSSLGATGSSTTPSASLTVVASTQVTLLGGCYGGGTSSIGAGFTAGGSTDGNVSEYKLSTGSGAQSVAFTQSPSQAWTVSAIAFLDAAGGSTVTAVAAAVTGDIVTPTVAAGATIASPAGAATGVLLAPGVSGTGSANPVATPAAGSGDLVAPTVTANATVVAPPLAGAGAFPPAGGLLSSEVTSPAATGAGDLVAPAVSGGAGGGQTVTAPPMIVTGAMAAPSVTAGASVASPAMAVTGAMVPPGAAASGGVSAVPMAATGDAPSPALVASALLAAVPLLGQGDLVAPAVTGLVLGHYVGAGRSPAGRVSSATSGRLSVAPAGTLAP